MSIFVPDASKTRGAIYIPAKAYHAQQMWAEFDSQIAARDFGYARSIKLNALRIWLSYERWLADAAKLEKDVDALLTAADEHGLRVMMSLFERCGVDPTPETVNDRDARTAVCLRSPHSKVVSDPKQWKQPVDYVRWFMKRFGEKDKRLLAVEICNEPGGPNEHKFTRAMMKVANESRGEVPFTVGSLIFEDSRLYQDLGLDILQAHENFHRSEKDFRDRLKRFVTTQEIIDRPVMVTEWQRIRPGGSGWGDEPVTGDEWKPAFATMAPILRDYPLGSFLWSLMVKPAYLPAQRVKGTINGVFHEDGAVWSLADARAIANDPSFEAEERGDVDDWMKPMREGH